MNFVYQARTIMDNMLIGSTLLALGKDEGSRSIAKISLFISSCEGIWIQGYSWMSPPFTVININLDFH